MKVFKFCLLTLLQSPVFADEVAVPSDLKLEQPTADVPAQCALFFSPGGWGEGKWDDMRPGKLWIEKINPDCSAQVVYSYGSWPGRGDPPGYFRVFDDRIADARLTIQVKVNQSLVTVVYKLHDDSGLRGVWKMEGRNSTSTIRLKRVSS